MSTPRRPPIVWAIAGLDSSGGAGLSADQRAADALEVHLCPILACLTAQHSQGLDAVYPVSAVQLEAQLSALFDDLPPQAIKTGLLYDPALIKVVAHWVDQLRQVWPTLPLIVDPVLGASAGGVPAHRPELLQTFREVLLPRTTVLTPNRAEAALLLGLTSGHSMADTQVPQLARELKALGPQGVIITGGDAGHKTWSVDWIDLPHAQGWLCAPRVPTPNHHGTGCTFASALASAMAMGHTAADAAVMGKMVTHQALLEGHSAGRGAGPVVARRSTQQPPLPWLGLHEHLPWRMSQAATDQPELFRPYRPPHDGLYGIVANADMVEAAAQAKMQCIQLRHKSTQDVLPQIKRAVQACQRTGATLFINDHWRYALEQMPADAVHFGIHLGQEDLMALSDEDALTLREAAPRLLLGLSSHSLWELARAAGCGPSLIACGPILPTETKDMPWRPQGIDNLRWWIKHSPAPVVAIGGLLSQPAISSAHACQPAAVCLVRALGVRPGDVSPALEQTRQYLREHMPSQCPVPTWPHPMLPAL